MLCENCHIKFYGTSIAEAHMIVQPGKCECCRHVSKTTAECHCYLRTEHIAKKHTHVQ